MNKKQILVKGYEIGIKNRDSIEGQIALANEMTNIKDDVSFNLCESCINANNYTCKYQEKTNVIPSYSGVNVGFSYVITKCNGHEQQK